MSFLPARRKEQKAHSFLSFISPLSLSHSLSLPLSLLIIYSQNNLISCLQHPPEWARLARPFALTYCYEAGLSFCCTKRPEIVVISDAV